MLKIALALVTAFFFQGALPVFEPIQADVLGTRRER